jgi:spermidine/putrescine transport system ATP-binding protein
MAYDLECIGVTKTFGLFTAVDRISLQVPQGQFFSILGPSGCGKTTLMRMIAGFEQPTSGDIRINGQTVLATPPNRRPVNMVFQHLALFPMMSVAENIGYGLRRRGLARADIAKRVDTVLQRIGLPDAGPKRISQLSGGQKQRVAIARCMVLDPTVLLLDEPLGALDLKLREHMKLELKQLQHQFGTTFLYITHDQSEALVMSDQVAVMKEGRFEQVGTPQELYFKPKTAFVAGFVGDSQRWRGRVKAQAGGDIETETASGLSLRAVVAGDSSLATGAAVDLFVRPEAIEIARAGAPAPAAPNRLLGKVESLLFNGANSRAMVRIRSDDLVAVAMPATVSLSTLGVGADVELRFAPEQLLAFAAAETPA